MNIDSPPFFFEIPSKHKLDLVNLSCLIGLIYRYVNTSASCSSPIPANSHPSAIFDADCGTVTVERKDLKKEVQSGPKIDLELFRQEMLEFQVPKRWFQSEVYRLQMDTFS